MAFDKLAAMHETCITWAMCAVHIFNNLPILAQTHWQLQYTLHIAVIIAGRGVARLTHFQSGQNGKNSHVNIDLHRQE